MMTSSVFFSTGDFLKVTVVCLYFTRPQSGYNHPEYFVFTTFAFFSFSCRNSDAWAAVVAHGCREPRLSPLSFLPLKRHIEAYEHPPSHPPLIKLILLMGPSPFPLLTSPIIHLSSSYPP